MAKAKSRRESAPDKPSAPEAAPAPTAVEPVELAPPGIKQKLVLGLMVLLTLAWVGFLAALATHKIGGNAASGASARRAPAADSQDQ